MSRLSWRGSQSSVFLNLLSLPLCSCQTGSRLLRSLNSWGVIQDSLVEQKVAAASTLAFVGSVAVACNAAFAIVNARLVRALGARKVAMLGIMLMSIAQVLSGFSQKNIGGLFVTAGFMMGYGVRYVTVQPRKSTLSNVSQLLLHCCIRRHSSILQQAPGTRQWHCFCWRRLGRSSDLPQYVQHHSKIWDFLVFPCPRLLHARHWYASSVFD